MVGPEHVKDEFHQQLRGWREHIQHGALDEISKVAARKDVDIPQEIEELVKGVIRQSVEFLPGLWIVAANEESAVGLARWAVRETLRHSELYKGERYEVSLLSFAEQLLKLPSFIVIFKEH